MKLIKLYFIYFGCVRGEITASWSPVVTVAAATKKYFYEFYLCTEWFEVVVIAKLYKTYIVD